jgi:hypothetical protein
VDIINFNGTGFCCADRIENHWQDTSSCFPYPSERLIDRRHEPEAESSARSRRIRNHSRNRYSAKHFPAPSQGLAAEADNNSSDIERQNIFNKAIKNPDPMA